jgi:hypothetical protein
MRPKQLIYCPDFVIRRRYGVLNSHTGRVRPTTIENWSSEVTSMSLVTEIQEALVLWDHSFLLPPDQTPGSATTARILTKTSLPLCSIVCEHVHISLKAKLSLFLTKYHATNIYPLLN